MHDKVIDHYECCHKPLPEFSSIESLSQVHHSLGFLPDPTTKETYLEEVGSDGKAVPGTKHCFKIINGELFLFCNIKTRKQFIEANSDAFDFASSIEIDAQQPPKTATQEASQNTNSNATLSISKDISTLIEGLTLPMNEE